MDLIEVRLGTNEQHFTYIRPSSVWLAFPEGNGATKLYLTFNMETAFPPQALQEDTPDSDLLLGLFRWRLTDDIGSTLITPAGLGEVLAACPDLVMLTIRQDVSSFPIGLRRDMIDAITPAYNKVGDIVGSHLVVRRVCMEANGRLLPLLETPDAVLRACGWEMPTVTLGRTDRVLTGEPRLVVPGKFQ